MVVLDYNAILYIHDWCQKVCNIKRAGNGDIIHKDMLISIVTGIYQTFDGVELYDSVEKKAAYLWYSISQSHSFIDGNKRTALITALTFLRLNNMSTIYENDLYAVSIDLAKSSLNKNDLLAYIERNVKMDSNTFTIQEILSNFSENKVLMDVIAKLSK